METTSPSSSLLSPSNATAVSENTTTVTIVTPATTPTIIGPSIISIIADQNVTGTPSQEPAFNGTGYYLENEDGDSGGFLAGFSDIQTLFLACFATLVPLFISLGTAFAVRLIWKRYVRSKECRDYEEGSLHGEESTEPLSRPLHSHLLASDKIPGGMSDLDVRETTETTSTATNRTGNHCSANGSIITMTMKNNHLIVETEERDDLEEDSRETTMKYSPGARDGVFVVEVQQGVRRSPGSEVPKSIKSREKSGTLSVSDQCALVHNPPDRYSDEDTLEECDEDDYYGESHSSQESVRMILARCKTGLSTSSQSISSEQNYRYGNQQGYDNGHYGYPIYNGYCNDEPADRLPEPNKPKITSALYKPNRRLESCASIDPGPDGPLNSDARCKEYGLAHQQDDPEDAIQKEQMRLGNGVDSNGTASTNTSSTTNVCNQIKGILPGKSKFERLKNDLSPSPQDFELSVNKKSSEYQNSAFESC